jgi:ubiquinone/menaquinone biosynthesis C-methylase UbiE
MWPSGWAPIPDQEWTRTPADAFALKYDAVQRHGWYQNLAPTVDDVLLTLEDGTLWIDYSGGTGILADQVFRKNPPAACACAIVDSSAKFLRLAVDKLRHEPRVAYRLLRYHKDTGRLQTLDDVLPPEFRGRIGLLTSTNAIHLYHELDRTLDSWRRALKPGGSVLVQSGNILGPGVPDGTWIIDDTVAQLQVHAMELIGNDSRYSRLQSATHDMERQDSYRHLREKLFVPPRHLSFYLRELDRAGLEVEKVETRPVVARVDDWADFLSTYHEGVLGWVGGVAKIEGRPPTPADLQIRLLLLKDSLHRLFGGRQDFVATWTYIRCRCRK